MSLCIGSDRTVGGKWERSWVANIAAELAHCHGQEGVLGIILKKKKECQVNKLLPTWIFLF